MFFYSPMTYQTKLGCLIPNRFHVLECMDYLKVRKFLKELLLPQIFRKKSFLETLLNKKNPNCFDKISNKYIHVSIFNLNTFQMLRKKLWKNHWFFGKIEDTKSSFWNFLICKGWAYRYICGQFENWKSSGDAGKVHVFWEAHKNLKKYPNFLQRY